MPYRTFLAAASAAMLSLSATLPAQAQFVHDGDVVIPGGLCVGVDCSSGGAFGLNTFRLRATRPRLQFDDSSSGLFPSNDWSLITNPAIGNAEFFAIEDSTAGRQVFRVEAGARWNALYIEADGDIGIGTSNPERDIDIKTGNTPTIRLQQDGTNSFTPQTWDIAGNESAFLIRDNTNATLPFRITPAAPTDSIFIAANGEVGMGTFNPDGALHIKRASNAYFTLENTTDGRKWYFTHENAAPNRFIISRDDSGPEGLFLGADGSLRVGGNGTAGNGFNMDAAGNIAIGGALTQNSDKNSKMAIEPVDADDILAKVTALPVSAWTYNTDAEAGIRHIGPMAQDFYALFGTGASETGISSIDSSGVALAAIQALVAQNDAQRALNEELSLQVTALSLRLNMLEGLAAE